MKTGTGLNPNIFHPGRISSETVQFNAEIHRLVSSAPPTYTLAPQQIRDDREAGKGLWPVTRLDGFEDRKIPGASAEVSVRVHTPETINGVYLHMHGGGFMLGRAHHSDAILAAIAETCGVATVSVDYRLAPENPYPAAADDCEAAAVWLIEQGKQEFGSEAFVIGGDSAGGNLAAVTLLRMRDRHGYSGFAGANLVYGVYDLSGTPSAKNWGEHRKLVLTSRLMDWFHDNYIPVPQRRDPDASPLYADLHDLPPALFTVGTLDPLLDDSMFMYSRWLAAGNQAELALYPGAIHAFNVFPIEVARQANERIGRFISEAVRRA